MASPMRATRSSRVPAGRSSCARPRPARRPHDRSSRTAPRTVCSTARLHAGQLRDAPEQHPGRHRRVLRLPRRAAQRASSSGGRGGDDGAGAAAGGGGHRRRLAPAAAAAAPSAASTPEPPAPPSAADRKALDAARRRRGEPVSSAATPVAPGRAGLKPTQCAIPCRRTLIVALVLLGRAAAACGRPVRAGAHTRHPSLAVRRVLPRRPVSPRRSAARGHDPGAGRLAAGARAVGVAIGIAFARSPPPGRPAPRADDLRRDRADARRRGVCVAAALLGARGRTRRRCTAAARCSRSPRSPRSPRSRSCGRSTPARLVAGGQPHARLPGGVRRRRSRSCGCCPAAGPALLDGVALACVACARGRC